MNAFSTKPRFLLVGVWAVLLAAGCVSDDQESGESGQPSSSEVAQEPDTEVVGPSTTVSALNPVLITLPPPAVLPTEEWPANPETNVWYRLTLVVGHCEGPIRFAVPERPPGILYINRAVLGTDEWKLIRAGIWESDRDSVPGYGRITPEGDLEFSMDTVNGRIIYTATPVEDLPPCM